MQRRRKPFSLDGLLVNSWTKCAVDSLVLSFCSIRSRALQLLVVLHILNPKQLAASFLSFFPLGRGSCQILLSKVIFREAFFFLFTKLELRHVLLFLLAWTCVHGEAYEHCSMTVTTLYQRCEISMCIFCLTSVLHLALIGNAWECSFYMHWCFSAQCSTHRWRHCTSKHREAVRWPQRLFFFEEGGKRQRLCIEILSPVRDSQVV